MASGLSPRFGGSATCDKSGGGTAHAEGVRSGEAGRSLEGGVDTGGTYTHNSSCGQPRNRRIETAIIAGQHRVPKRSPISIA